MRVIVFPIFEARICGFPDTVRLTDSEAKAMERIHLGGMGALRTPDYSCACKTVSSLARKGLLGKDGPTDFGRRVGRAVAETEVQ